MLEVGKVAPRFQAVDQDGRTVSSEDFHGRRVVLWFYPKADTPGWTKQGTGFRDRARQFADRKVEILGVSFDSPADNKAFAEKFQFPFRLLCDTDRKVGMAYGVCAEPNAKSAKRYTFVIGPDGKVEQAIDTKDPAGQADALLASMPK
jgi:thioredoxin-dependent peroxiredoxin